MDPIELSRVEAAFREAALGPSPDQNADQPKTPTINDYFAAGNLALRPWGAEDLTPKD